jgi:hypothetical protein
MATTAGAILVVLYATVLTTTLRRASKSSYINTSIPTALITLTLAEAAMLAVGRSGFGAQEAIMSRYSMLAIPGVIGLYLAVTARCIEGLRKRPWQLALGFVLGIIVLGAPLSDWNGLIEAAASRAQRAELAYDLTAYQVQSNSTLSQLYPDYALVRREAPVLEQYRLNVFSTAPTDLDRLPYSRSNVGFAVDLVGGHLLVSTPKPVQLGAGDHAIRVTGWAFDQPHGRAAGAVFVRLDTDPPFPCLYGLARPDIAAFFRNSRYRNAGFMCSFSESILSPGRHILTVEILSHDRQRYVVGQPSIAVVAQ